MNDTDVYRETENWKGHKISWSCNGSLESVWLDWPHASRTEVSIQWLQFSNPRKYKHVSIHEESQKYVVQTLKELLLALIGLHWWAPRHMSTFYNWRNSELSLHLDWRREVLELFCKTRQNNKQYYNMVHRDVQADYPDERCHEERNIC